MIEGFAVYIAVILLLQGVFIVMLGFAGLAFLLKRGKAGQQTADRPKFNTSTLDRGGMKTA